MLRYLPDLETARLIAGEYASGAANGAGEVQYLLPVALPLPGDLETPLGAYLKLTQGRTDTGFSFLLESVIAGTGPARYSFAGADPFQVLTVPRGQSPFDVVRAAVSNRRVIEVPGLPMLPFSGGAVGYIGYESVGTFEPVPPAANDPHSSLPLALLGLYDTLVVYDHAHSQMLAVALVPLTGDLDEGYSRAVERLNEIRARLAGPLPDVVTSAPPHRNGSLPGERRSNMDRARYEQMVEDAKEHIRAGDIIQVVLSQRMERHTNAHPLAIYRALKAVNPSPYMFYLQLGDFQLIGASPETLVQVRDGQISMRPIAGTRRRGKTKAEDDALEAGLLADEKERAEHLMLVDLGRNDVGRVAETASVRVPQLYAVEYYSHVMHIVSHVSGVLRAGKSAVDALQSSFPAGTLSGAPKVRAMQIIAELEQDQRGPYGGAAGYIGFNGNMDTAIVIRTVLLRNGLATVQAGAGIVADSVPSAEYDESLNKAQAIFTAIDRAEATEPTVVAAR